MPALHETKTARQQKSNDDEDVADDDDEEQAAKVHPKILTKAKNVPSLKETKAARVSQAKGKQQVEVVNEDEEDDEVDETDLEEESELDVNVNRFKNKKHTKSHESTSKSVLKQAVNSNIFIFFRLLSPLSVNYFLRVNLWKLTRILMMMTMIMIDALVKCLKKPQKLKTLH